MLLQAGETCSIWNKDDCLHLTGKQCASREAMHLTGESELQDQLLKGFAPKQLMHIHL